MCVAAFCRKNHFEKNWDLAVGEKGVSAENLAIFQLRQLLISKIFAKKYC